MRIAFSGCGQHFWLPIAEQVEQEGGHEVCLWYGGMRIRDAVRERFAKVLMQSGRATRNGVLSPDFADIDPAPLDAGLLAAMAPHESIAMKMMERFDLCDYFPYQDRARLYHRVLMCVVAIVDCVRPDAVVFNIAPHVVSDYLLYALCQVRGIPTMMFERTLLPDRVFAWQRFEDGSVPILQDYGNRRASFDGATVDLADDLEAYLAEMTGGYDKAMPPRLKHKLAGAVKTAGKGSSLISSAARAVRVLAALARQGAPVSGKRRGRPFEDQPMGRLEFIGYRLDVRRKRRRLLETYQSLARRPDLNKPYVYAALQCQPERQASPMGGVYAHQNLMVDALAKCVPDGWQVYVKEHISQYNDYQTPERGRDETYYRDMAALPNVTLVPMDAPAFDLIDKARAVATISGSSGWEAVVRGRPALLFGNAWYRGCDGVYHVPDTDDLRQALVAVAGGTVPDPAMVRIFVDVVDAHSVSAFVDPVMEAVTGIAPEENGRRLAGLVMDFLSNTDMHQRTGAGAR